MIKRIKCFLGFHKINRLKGLEEHPFYKHISDKTKEELHIDYCENCKHLVGEIV